jgi:hypothetical protein
MYLTIYDPGGRCFATGRLGRSFELPSGRKAGMKRALGLIFDSFYWVSDYEVNSTF